MVNQNPQPELYTTRHAFVNGNAQGATTTNQIYTNQSFNEEVRIYGMMINIVDENGDSLSYANLVTQETVDFDVNIQAGPNFVPSTSFSATSILRASDRTLAFSAPVLVLHRQPLQVAVSYQGSSAFGASEDLTIIVTLISEMYIREE